MLIKIDLADVISEFQLLEAQAEVLTQSVLDQVTAEIFRSWQNQARQQLKSTRNQYINGLQWYNEGRLKNVIVLNGDFPNKIESGMSAFDMKEGFRKSKKAKAKEDGGWYLTIPFRFGTPGSLGENEAFSNIMPEEVYKAVKKLKAAKTSLSGKKSSGSKLVLPTDSKYGAKQTRLAFSDVGTKQTFNAYEHKSNIYEGMIKQNKTYEMASQNTYMTFRRVSNNSDPMSWIHKGIKAYNLAEKALQSINLQQIQDIAIDNALNEIL